MVQVQNFTISTLNVSVSPTAKSHRRPKAWDVGGQKAPVRARREGPPAAVVALRTKPYAEMEDLELLRHVIEGKDAAWNVFMARFRGLIISCAIKVAARSGKRLDSDELMDVFGDVSLNLVKRDFRRLRLYREDGGCSVASWIGVIATSTTRDYLRRARRHRLEPIAEAELDRHAAPTWGPEDIAIDRERRNFVDAALNTLSARDREFVHLYFAQAEKPEVIAEKMGVSLSTVYSKKAKIKTRLTRMAAQLS